MPRFGTWSPASAALSAGAHAAKPCARLPHDRTERLALRPAAASMRAEIGLAGRLRALADAVGDVFDRASGGHRRVLFGKSQGAQKISTGLSAWSITARIGSRLPGASAASSHLPLRLAFDVQRHEAGTSDPRQRQSEPRLAGARRLDRQHQRLALRVEQRRQVGRVREERSGMAVLPHAEHCDVERPAEPGKRLAGQPGAGLGARRRMVEPDEAGRRGRSLQQVVRDQGGIGARRAHRHEPLVDQRHRHLVPGQWPARQRPEERRRRRCRRRPP